MNILANACGLVDSPFLSPRNHLALAKGIRDFARIGNFAVLSGGRVGSCNWFTRASFGQENSQSPDAASKAPQPDQGTPRFLVKEYCVEGGYLIETRCGIGSLSLSRAVSHAARCGTGPRRLWSRLTGTRDFQTSTVLIPPQHAQVIRPEHHHLQVLQRGSGPAAGPRFALFFHRRDQARSAVSCREGQSPNFSQVTHDLVVAESAARSPRDAHLQPGRDARHGRRRSRRQGHVSAARQPRINNRYSADTTPLRVNGSVSYDNLWQLEHSIGFSFQLSPEDIDEVKVFSGYYPAQFPDLRLADV